jgi:dienelactone hydrolase
MEDDGLGDVDNARELAGTIEDAELFLYPGDQHLFTDNSLPAYDEQAAAQVTQRALSFLDRVGQRSAGAHVACRDRLG